MNITGASIGRVSLVNNKITGGNVNQHVCIIRPNSTLLLSLYLKQILLSKIGQDQINSFQAGGNREGLNFAQIGSFNIPTPPTLQEQQAIAQILSDQDTEIQALEAKRDKYQQLKQGMMQELLTGKTRLI